MWGSILFLSAAEFACLAGNAFAVPLDFVTAAPPEASLTAAIKARQAAPTDFGTTTVTATIDGNAIPFTQHYGIDLTNSGNNDEDYELSAPLLAAIQALVADDSMCSSTTPQTRDDTDPIIGQLNIGPCTEDRARWGLGNMIIGGNGGIIDIVPANAVAASVVDFVAGGLRSLQMRLNAVADDEDVLGWATEDQRRAASILITALVIAGETASIQDNKVVIAGSNFAYDQSKDCSPPPDQPSCQASDCHGFGGVCTTAANKGCTCNPLAQLFPPMSLDPAGLDAQQQAFLSVAQSAVDSVNPSCYGIGTQHYFDPVVGGINVKDLCASDINGNMTISYNSRTSNEVSYSVAFDSDFTLGADQCLSLFQKILDGCDGNNPDNLGNWKHGGTIVHPAGATLSIDPQAGPEPHCNGYTAGNWVDIDSGVSAVTQFCNQINLNGKEGARSQTTFNSGQPTQITLQLLFTKDFTMSVDDCVEALRVPLDGCDANDPINNPDGNKYGGFYATGDGVVINVVPNAEPPVFPPDEVDTNGNPISPICAATKGYWVDEATTNTAIAAYCVDGNPIGNTGPGTLYGGSGIPGTYVHVTSALLDAAATYQQGSTVCRDHAAWQGKIIAEDCMWALNHMRDACTTGNGFYTPTYAFNCVQWGLTTSFFK